MSSFPKIDPNHPLTVAARDVNSYAEEYGLESTIEWLKMGAAPGEVAYLAEQRAYRALVAALEGVNLGSLPPDEANRLLLQIREMPLWKDFSPIVISAYMDGMAIGWRAHELSER